MSEKKKGHHYRESEEERAKRWNLNSRKRRKLFSKILFMTFTILAIAIACFVVYIYTVE